LLLPKKAAIFKVFSLISIEVFNLTNHLEFQVSYRHWNSACKYLNLEWNFHLLFHLLLLRRQEDLYF